MRFSFANRLLSHVRLIRCQLLLQRVFPGFHRKDWRRCLTKHTDQLSVVGCSVDENPLNLEWIRLDAGEQALDRVCLVIIAVNWFDRQRQRLPLCKDERCAVAMTLRGTITGLHPAELVFILRMTME